MASAIEPRTGGVEAPSMKGAQVRAPVATAARNRIAGQRMRGGQREGQRFFEHGLPNYSRKPAYGTQLNRHFI